MKKSTIVVIILALLVITARAQESSFRISTGYAVRIGSRILDEEYTFPRLSGNIYYRALSPGFGTGISVGASYMRMFSKHVGLEFHANYQVGTKQVNWMYPDVACLLETNSARPY